MYPNKEKNLNRKKRHDEQNEFRVKFEILIKANIEKWLPTTTTKNRRISINWIGGGGKINILKLCHKNYKHAIEQRKKKWSKQ